MHLRVNCLLCKNTAGLPLVLGYLLRGELELTGGTSQESNPDLLGHHFLAFAVHRGNLIAV
jgi:hypothetical protein